MSQIAHALAKAKEHTTAPFAVPGAPGQAVKPGVAPKIKNTQRTWVVLLSFVIVFGGLSMWYSGRFKLEPEGVGAGASAAPGVANPGSGAEMGTGSAASNPVNLEPVPHPEVQDRINALVISAVMPGQQPRIVLQGRVIAAGQPIDGTLVFSGIKDDRLLFTDTEGAVYARRY
jgi:hypothetical protein